MIFSNSCKYVLRAVLYLAVNSDKNKRVRVDEIAEALNLPKHFLAKGLQRLAKHGLVSSVKGRNGGFFLTDENRSINLLAVVEVIDGPIRMNECILGLPKCSDEKPCPYHTTAMTFKTGIYQVLKDETIDDCSKRVDYSEVV